MIGWQERRVAHQHKHCHLKLKSTSEKASLVSKILRQVIWLLLLTPSKLRIKLICAASNTAKKCLTEGFHAYSNKHFLQTVAFNYSLCYASLQGTHIVSRETKDWPSNILFLLLLTNLCSTVTFVCYWNPLSQHWTKQSPPSLHSSSYCQTKKNLRLELYLPECHPETDKGGGEHTQHLTHCLWLLHSRQSPGSFEL